MIQQYKDVEIVLLSMVGMANHIHALFTYQMMASILFGVLNNLTSKTASNKLVEL